MRMGKKQETVLTMDYFVGSELTMATKGKKTVVLTSIFVNKSVQYSVKSK